MARKRQFGHEIRDGKVVVVETTLPPRLRKQPVEGEFADKLTSRVIDRLLGR